MRPLVLLGNVIVLLFACFVGSSTVRAANITNVPQIVQLSSSTVVVSWKTDVPSSSQVKYSSSSFLTERITPEYASNTTDHQIKILGLNPSYDYVFVAVSGDSSGVATSVPIGLILRPLGSDNRPIENFELTKPGSTISLGERVRQSFANLGSIKNEIVAAFSQSREQSLAQQGSIFAVILAGVLLVLGFFLEEFSLLLFFDWLFAILAFRVWRNRNAKNSFRIYDGITNRPISGAQVLIVDKISNVVLRTVQSDSYGRIIFDWPADHELSLRITREGYQALNIVFSEEVYDVKLIPLTHIVNDNGVVGAEIKFQLRHSLRVINIFLLSLGTLFLVPLLIDGMTGIDFVTIIAYLYLWLLFFKYMPRRYHIGKVINAQTERPVPYASVVLYRKNKAEHRRTNAQGVVLIPYPLPDFISLSKKGFVGNLRQTIPFSSVSPDPIIMALKPR